MKVTTNRTTSRDGVNALRTLLDHAGWIVQEVDQQNDFGKDMYVDIAQNGVVTPLCIAMQIKSGDSYRTGAGDYVIPVNGHGSTWRRSTIPVFGVIYDPSDKLLRWVDVTTHLRAHRDQEPNSLRVPASAVLNEFTLRRDFLAAVMLYAPTDRDNVAANLLSRDIAIQRENVWDTWALGRHDSRYLILLRRLVLDLRTDAIRQAIDALSHACDHPNRFGTPLNRIPERIGREARQTFRWSVEEIVHFVAALEASEYGYHQLGESLDVLFYCDSAITPKLRSAIGVFLSLGDTDRAVRAATLALSHSDDARTELNRISAEYPSLHETEWFPGVAAEVNACDRFSIYV